MKNRFIAYFGSHRICTILTLLLILTISGIPLSSCSTARSVRGGKLISSIPESDKSVKSKNIESNEIIAEIDEIGDKEVNHANIKAEKEPMISENVIRQIPTLREQMMAIVEEQKSSSGRLEKIEDNISEIKELIRNMSYDIADVKSDMNILPETGNTRNHASSNAISPSNDNNKTILMPDEVSKPTSKTNSTTKKDILSRAVNETYLEPDETVAPKRNRAQQPSREAEVTESKATVNNIVISDSEELTLGKNLYEKGSYAQALSSFQRALQSETSKTKENEINLNIGKCYYQIGDYDNALAHFSKVINSSNSQFTDHAQLLSADSKLKSGKINEAKGDYRKLIESNPNSPFAPKARKMLQKL
ncbi:MAG: tetratricopeptide repeat protein [Candidatus Kapabacteria bacterium]|nr:tetratricopeptide repeat protein [Candidatus Kapabacteria bacterium]